MKAETLFSISLVLMAAMGCSGPAKTPDVADGIRKSLNAANLKDVSVTQDRDKGVVTLGGKVASDAEKSQAAAIAKSMAGPQVVSNEIAVIPPGDQHDARTINSDVDSGIEKNLDAALVQQRLKQGVSYKVKNGVVTLTGDVASEAVRSNIQRVAASVPYVQQVVNELQVKNQRATSSN